MKKQLYWLLIGSFLAGFLACSKQVSRVNTSETIDLSGRWNDTDSQLAASELTSQALTGAWIPDFMKEHGEKPVVIVGLVTNKTHEHIDSETFIKEIERAMINSGRVRLVQGGEKRNELRAERGDQQDYAAPETIKAWGKEVGADFMMQGNISSIVDKEKKKEVIYYQIDLEMSHLETNEVVWIGDKKIKKYVTN